MAFRSRSASRAASRRPRRLKLETLENRRLLAVSAGEQEFIYLLNRARHDPAAYATEVNLGVDLSSVVPRPPLAVNEQLLGSSGFHAEEMAAYDYFGHTSEVTGDQPNKMARDAGYPLPQGWSNDANYIESAAAGFATAAAALKGLIHDGGGPTGGHRSHLLGIGDFWAANTEIGVGYAHNSTSTYKHYWAIHATHRGAPMQFLTGVVFQDKNNNQRYDGGEGLANVTITAGGLTTTTNEQGGWSLEVADGEYLVTASGGAFQGTAMVPVAVQGESVEVDFLSGQAGGQINFQTWVNSAPVLDASGDPTLKPVVQGIANPPGELVASFLGGAMTDADPAALQGIAIIGAAGNAAGVWQYSLDDGATWLDLGAVSSSAAQLLRDRDLVRFVPAAGASGTASLTYRAWDRTTGQPGSVANLTAGVGGSTAFSAAQETALLTVLATNTPPTLQPTGDRALPPIAEDTTTSNGVLVSDLLGTTATDPDPGTKMGLALTAANVTNGVWEYSEDDGDSWLPVGAVSSAAALLLRDLDRLRFIPKADFNGEATIDYRAWDQMFGEAGSKTSLSESGSANSFSIASDTARITVTPVNDAPVLDPQGQPKLRPIPSNPTSNPPQLVADILGNLVTDVDEGALQGIAIIGVTGNGTWWFHNDGRAMSGSTSPNFAWLLKATDRIEFSPAPGWTGTATFTFRAWDQTTGPEQGGTWANVSNPSRYGGTTAYSAATLTATLVVGDPGAAPVVQSVVRTDPNPTSQTSLSFEVRFSEDVVNVTPADFRVETTGSVTGEVTAVSGGGAVYTVTVGNVTGEGTLALGFDEKHDIKDAIGNPLDLRNFAGSEVYDVEVLQLLFSLSNTQSSEGALIPAATGTITRVGGNLAGPLIVTLVNSDPTEVSVPATVTIPAGETSVSILINAVDDTLLDGPQTVQILATAPGYQSASQSLVINDHESLTIRLDATMIAENAGPAAVSGVVERSNTDTDLPLTVHLTSSDSGEVTAPATVTIPAGARSAAFSLHPVSDGVRDGTQTVTITATAAGYFPGSAVLSITDSDGLTVADDVVRTDEDQPVIIDVLANDASQGAVLDPTSVRIVIPPAAGAVNVDPSTGRITYTPKEDFFGEDSFTYTVSDDGGLSAQGRVMITVDSVNDAPTSIALDHASVDENVRGAVVGRLSVNDPDPNDTHTWRVDDPRFEVVAGMLKLRDGIALNYEVEPSVTVRITASDSGTPPGSVVQDFVITVQDREEVAAVWRNPTMAEDIDGNGIVNLNDLLQIVRALRASGGVGYQLAEERDASEDILYLDVNGDGYASLADLLDVVRRLRQDLLGA